MFLAFGDALVGTLARFGDFIVVNQFFGKGKVWVVT
jgi:hypothetical protein